jgi:NADH dehydrogenase
MILVTGASGYVGGHVVARLAAGSPTEVRAMVRSVASYRPPGGVSVVEADVTHPASLPAALEGVDTVVHCVAITGDFKEPYKGAYDAINRVGTENLVAAAVGAGVKRLVVMSGLGTRPAPSNTYMATRWGLEEAVRGSGIPYAILRPSVQFGDGAEFVAALARLAKRSPVVPLLGGGGLLFQPIWVEDVVSCIEKLIASDQHLGREVTIGGAEQLNFKEIIEAILRAMGKRRILAPLPLPIARIGAGMMQVLPHPPLTPASLELFSFDNITTLDAVDREFGFHPQAFREYLEAHGIEA